MYLGETHLAFLYQSLYLSLRYTQLGGKLFSQWNTTSEELVEVLRVEPALHHGRAVEVGKVVDGDGQTCRDVAQPYQRFVDLLCLQSVGQQLLGTAGNISHTEWCSGGGLYELLHERVGLCLAPEHGLERDLQLLKLTAHGGKLRAELPDAVNGKRADDHVAQAAERFIHRVTLFRCGIADTRQNTSGFSRPGSQGGIVECRTIVQSSVVSFHC